MKISPVLCLLISIGVVALHTACAQPPDRATNQPASKSTLRPQDLSASESQALSNLAAMVNEQFTIYSLQTQFSPTGRDFRGGFPASNQDYSYQIVQVTSTKVYMTATAQQPNLRSLSAQVFVLPAASRPQAYQNSPINGSICVTNVPSQLPPADPGEAIVAEPPCPNGSSSMGVFYPSNRKE